MLYHWSQSSLSCHLIFSPEVFESALEVVDFDVGQVVEHRQVVLVVRPSDVDADERHASVATRDVEATPAKSVQSSPRRRQKVGSRLEEGSNLGQVLLEDGDGVGILADVDQGTGRVRSPDVLV